MVVDTGNPSTLETIVGIMLLIFVIVMVWRWTASGRRQ